MSYNLGFIGGGNMSTAIVQGILKNDSHPSSKIWVSGPHIENLKHWKDMGTNVTTENSEVFTNCDIIFLGVKPGMCQEAIEECITPQLEPSKRTVLFVSMLAGVNMLKLNQDLSILSRFAQCKIVRIMPNTPMTVGSGCCIYTPADNVTSAECTLLEKLLSTSSICEKVPETLMDSLGVLTSCGPAFMYMVIEALADGAVKQGVPRTTAIRFAAQMVVGSGQMVLQTGKHPGILKDEVCSPGGSTICGVAALENGKLRGTLINAIEASTLKTKGMAGPTFNSK